MITTMHDHNLYEDVVTVTYDYLGPAADRFVVRQIRNHLHKEPDQIDSKDLRKLMDWIRLAMQLIRPDQALVDQYMADLNALSRRNKSTPRNDEATS